MADIVFQAQSTAFRRQGDTWQTKKLIGANGSELDTLMSNTLRQAAVDTSLKVKEQTLLGDLLTQDDEYIAGGTTLYNIHAITSFDGEAELLDLIARDPNSTEFETETETSFREAFDYARSVAQSAPTNVRGGTARMSFELAELDAQISMARWKAVNDYRMEVIEQNMRATSLLQTVKGQIRRDQLQAQQQQAATEQGRVMQQLAASEALSKLRNDVVRLGSACAEFFCWPQMWTNESIAGEGMQNGATTSFGSSTFR